MVVIGQNISILGSAILRYVLDLYVLDVTGQADIFELVLALSTIPGIIFTPIGGGIADRLNRHNLMVIFDFSCSATVFVLLLLFNMAKIPMLMVGVILAILLLISSVYQSLCRRVFLF